MSEFSHTSTDGKANMVDVGDKPNQKRKAIAQGTILLKKHTIDLIKQNEIKKGDVLAVARIAGIQAAKKTWDLIPLCHNIPLNKVEVNATLTEGGVEVTSEVRCSGKTGVEMEALTAVQIALLTIYDMCKAVDKEMRIENVTLLEKTKQ